MYLLRLDDASEFMDLDKWKRVESLLDKYNIKPIYGIIPYNQDPELLNYKEVRDFWSIVKLWQNKGWTPALHGYTHVFETECGGMNPVNTKSEFAGLEFTKQRDKIKKGFAILKSYNIEPHIFFAPAHTFDENTLKALKIETPIRIINDTIANNFYYKNSFFFIPQQSGRVRILPFKIVTFCYHPNVMTDSDFEKLDKFLAKKYAKFKRFEDLMFFERNESFLDLTVRNIYFFVRRIRCLRGMIGS